MVMYAPHIQRPEEGMELELWVAGNHHVGARDGALAILKKQ